MSQYIITKPTARTVHTIALENDSIVKLDFNPTETQVERTGNDLSVQFPNEGTVILSDFFVTDGAELPTLVLQDGTEIASADLLASLDPAMDISTAAGPATSSSSGLNAYGDGSGDLLDGVDRLDSLESFFWSGQGATQRLGIQPTLNLSQAGGIGENPPIDPIPDDKIIQSGSILRGSPPQGPGEGDDSHYPSSPSNDHPTSADDAFFKYLMPYADDETLRITSLEKPFGVLLGTQSASSRETPENWKAFLEIKAGAVDISLTGNPESSENTQIAGVQASGTENTLKLQSTTGDITIDTSASSPSGILRGLFNQRGRIELESKQDITISATSTSGGGNGLAHALSSRGQDSKTILKADGDITLNAKARGESIGVEMRSGSNTDSFNEISGSTVTINAQSTGKSATGIDNGFGGGLNHIESTDTVIDVRGYSDAIGLNANYNSIIEYNPHGISLHTRNHIEAKDSITLDVTSSNGDAKGLLAGDTKGVGVATENILEAGNSITVTVKGTGIAQAMHASGSKSSNLIMAGKGMDASDGANINITGDIHAEKSGKNNILTLGGNDEITIKGDISAVTGGKNTIDSGAGDDIITLNGAIAEGALTIRAGEGMDTLVLKADDTEQFNRYYKMWLTAFDDEEWEKMSIENVTIEVGNIDDLNKLDWLTEFFSSMGTSENPLDITLIINGVEVSLDFLDESSAKGLFMDVFETSSTPEDIDESLFQNAQSLAENINDGAHIPQQFLTGDTYLPENTTEDPSIFILQSVTGL